MPERRVEVAIVGGGFSGTMVAANLARRGIGSVVIEANGRAGQGTAFSTTEPAHLLNIRAQNMGAWADAPDDFVRQSGAEPGSYAERRQFGRYLRSILDDAVGSGNTDVLEGRAIAAERQNGSWRLTLQDGGAIESDALVLAIGNQPPAPLRGLEGAGDLLIDDPWSERAKRAVEDAAERQLDVLILGASLTMVDVALSLASAGHKGKILALSRRGKIPLGQAVHDDAPVEADELPAPAVRSVAKWLRERAPKVGWRAAVDALRPHSHRLWQAFPEEEKRRFLRFGRPWWDIHRHRIAPQVASQVETLISSGRLEVVAGRLLKARVDGGSIEITYRRRGHEKADDPHRFAYVFNCTGPLGDVTGTKEPILQQLLAGGEVRPDELSIGLMVDERSRASERLWALGTLTKGRYWEMIAVPDIRHQAAAVADDIAQELGR